jgi:peptidoglycan/xylan/chitin deacetylase (PgdA/CDA1 family)
MPLRRLGRSVREAWEVPRDLLLGRYPAFVTGGGLAPGEVPVFVFHEAEPESFARKLDHLARNGYTTLSIDEYLGVLRGSTPAPQRAVLLTFDDGRGSVWTVAAPLLRQRGMRAAVFLVPGRVPSHAPRPEGEDAALMSWQEIEALARAGYFDFQSHTLLHARVHTGPALAGFVAPQSRLGYSAFDQPLVRDGERDLIGDEVPLGTPLFRSSPRTSEDLRFFEDTAVRTACLAAVSDAGAEAFFRRPDWNARLRAAFSRVRVTGRLETTQEQADAIRRELVDARRIIEEHVGRPVVHLCYPWHTAGATARRLAAEAGYETAFRGKVDGVPVTLPGGDPRAIARVGEDYVELLPGAGRVTLAEVLRRKWARRFGRARE